MIVCSSNSLLSNVQRAEVESKSQRTGESWALHKVVIKCTKSWSWKQITTHQMLLILEFRLLSNVQRAEVESKSQLQLTLSGLIPCCYQMYKELKLKANHNNIGYYCSFVMLLSNVQRAEVESKSQQCGCCKSNAGGCYQMYKELKLKANHNGTRTVKQSVKVVIKCTKSWSWKQITTTRLLLWAHNRLLSNVQRAEVESKSQLLFLLS